MCSAESLEYSKCSRKDALYGHHYIQEDKNSHVGETKWTLSAELGEKAGWGALAKGEGASP